MLISSKDVKGMDKKKNTYKCDWCGFVFWRYVGKYTSGSQLERGGHQNVSTQVKCGRSCGNFIKTWE